MREAIFTPLGAVAYFMLTGLPPFNSDRPLKVMFAHAHEKVTPPSDLRGEIPADLEMVVLRCLAKNPRDRFQSAGELTAALGDCGGSGAWTRDRAAEWWLAVARADGSEAQLQPAGATA